MKARSEMNNILKKIKSKKKQLKHLNKKEKTESGLKELEIMNKKDILNNEIREYRNEYLSEMLNKLKNVENGIEKIYKKMITLIKLIKKEIKIENSDIKIGEEIINCENEIVETMLEQLFIYINKYILDNNGEGKSLSLYIMQKEYLNQKNFIEFIAEYQSEIWNEEWGFEKDLKDLKKKSVISQLKKEMNEIENILDKEEIRELRTGLRNGYLCHNQEGEEIGREKLYKALIYIEETNFLNLLYKINTIIRNILNPVDLIKEEVDKDVRELVIKKGLLNV